MIYIALGSNLGNRLLNLRKAVSLIKDGVLSNCYESIVIETKALLKENSPKHWDIPYLNMVVAGETHLNPRELLNALLEIEKKVGRIPNREPWAPRIIDLDILLYGLDVVDEPDLQIPHAELLNRNFLLHLLAMMPEKYLPLIKVGAEFIRADECAKNIFYADNLFDKAFVIGPQIVGILNVTPDSFSDGGKNFEPDQAIENAYKMVQDGAEVIDIGAQSTRPGSIQIGPDLEYSRLKPILDGIKGIEAEISIDTYHPALIRRLLFEYKIDFINDVSGRLEEDTLREIASSNCKIITMHSMSIPPRRELSMSNKLSAVIQLKNWCSSVANEMIRCGFKPDQIVLDPGIGFGKLPYQSLSIIRGAAEIKPQGCKILIGHSRKGFIESFYKSITPIDRDLETMALSQNLITKGVDYIRVHNVRDQQRSFVANKVSE